MNLKLIKIGICILFLLGINVNASTTYEEKSSIARIIGDEAFERSIKTAHDNIYMVKGADKVLGDTNIDDLAIVKAKAISQDGLVEGIKDVGRLDDAGVQLKQSWLKTLRNYGNNPGYFAEAKVAASRLDDMNVIAVSKSFDNYEYDVLYKFKDTNKGIVEEVKNGAFSVNEFEDAIEKLKYAKGKSIDGIEIIDVRLTVSDRFFNEIPDNYKKIAAENKISIITFKEVT